MTTAFKFTSADLECFPDIPGVRYEIIDGELYVSTAPNWYHQYACTGILAPLHAWSRETGAGAVVPGPGVIFAPDQNVIPDLAWVSSARLATILDAKGHLTFAPELVVEVLSPGRVNEIRDRELKLSLYSRQGVDEYWIVDWQARVVLVYRRSGAGLDLAATLSGTAALTSPLLPGFACAVSDLWDPAG
jgi:Uma2 family endonuclease